MPKQPTTLVSRVLGAGPGWSASDVSCDAGPHDRPFEERHGSVSLALVMRGTFQYRAASGTAVLGPGMVMLGDHGTCFECAHDHGRGDRCLAFHFEPGAFERIVAETPGARHGAFGAPRLPPSPALAPLVARAEAARDACDAGVLEEVALILAGTVLELLTPSRAVPRPVSWSEERRISTALRRIEAASDEPLSLADLAAEAGMSPYHFLRLFRRTTGITPHQFLLNRRLHRAAVGLRSSRAPIARVAADAGFGDLSTFNHRFRRVMGVTPSAFRAERPRAAR